VLGGVQCVRRCSGRAALCGRYADQCHRSSRNRRALGKQYQCDHSDGRITGRPPGGVDSAAGIQLHDGVRDGGEWNGSLNSFSNPAAAGSVVAIWITGGGAHTDTPDNQINASLTGNPYPVSVLATDPRIALAQPRRSRSVMLAMHRSFPSGVIQVNFVVPSGQALCMRSKSGMRARPFTLFARVHPVRK